MGKSRCRQYINRLVNGMVEYFHQQTCHLDEEEQQEILCKFVHHLSMSAAYNPEILLGGESLLEVMANLRSSLQVVKGSCSSDHLAAKNALLSMVVSDSNAARKKMKNKQATAKLLGVHKRNFKRAFERKQKIINEDGLWADGSRQPRSDKLSKEVIDLIQVFWAEKTRVSPNRKDVCRKKLGKGKENFVIHPTHYLEIPQVEMFLLFKEAYPLLRVGQRLFERWKPYYVKKLKERNTCCCVRHVQLDILRAALNAMRTTSDIHKDCRCDCSICEWKEGMQTCIAAEKTFSRLHEIWEMAVCPRIEGAEWHKLPCLLGECSKCGAKKVRFCPKELAEFGPLVEWKVYEDVKSKDKEGRPKSRKQLVSRRTPPAQLISFFHQHVQDFVAHNFTACWEDKQFKECVKNFPPGVIVSVVDFAENYTFKPQNEIQSEYFHSQQVTILVHITYRRESESDEPIKEYHFYLSDDKEHDTLFVQHCFRLYHEWAQKQGYEMNEHWVWSDGAAAHFKASRPFYFVSRYFTSTTIPMQWNFFCSGHGKGEHDGAGAKVKYKMEQEQLKANSSIEHNAHVATSWLTDNFSTGAAATCSSHTRDVKRYFWEVKIDDVNRREAWDCKTVEGTRKIHSIRGINKEDSTKVMTRQFACFCTFCMYGEIHQCENIKQIGGWKACILEPLRGRDGYNLRTHVDDVDDHTHLADLIGVGTIFAVEAPVDNEDGDMFWLVLCSVPKHTLQVDMVDEHGNRFIKGEDVLEGRYYRKYEGNRNTHSGTSSYIFGGKGSNAIVYAEQVIHIVVDMPQGHTVKGNKTVHLLGAADEEKILEKLI